jgi:release factor glutamine methyltransferase
MSTTSRSGRRLAAPLLAEARQRLATVTFDAPPREATLLLAHVLGRDEAALLARPELEIGDAEATRFESLLERRLQGEPIAYLVGEKEFYGRAFHVDRRVLVPRPETEHLVEAALARAPAAGERPRILDLGTGSGAIAITLSLELPAATVIATDLSIAAPALARVNRALHRAPVQLAASSMVDAVGAHAADLVVANLPYLDPADTAGLETEVLRWEPAGALFAGPGGLDRFRELFAATPRLRHGAVLLLEIGADQSDPVTALAAQYHLRRLDTVRDYAGHERVLILERGDRSGLPDRDRPEDC